jgi:hypothetical protein
VFPDLEESLADLALGRLYMAWNYPYFSGLPQIAIAATANTIPSGSNWTATTLKLLHLSSWSS